MIAKKSVQKEIDSLKYRDSLAVERTLMANERTTLAYIRTGLSAFLLGFGLIKLFEGTPFVVYLGYGALTIGLLFLLLGTLWYPVRKKKIKIKG